jgi:threonine dehydratase
MTGTHRLSLEDVHQAARTIDPIFRNTPQYTCEPLSAALGADLTLKVEIANPIRCFKGRGADYLISRLPSRRRLFTASAGNFGQAMAYACRSRGVPLTVYASVRANALKLDRMRVLGAEVVLAGDDFDGAKAAAREAAAAVGARFVEDGYDIETLAGAGTIALEWIEREALFDVVLIPLGNGALLNGVTRVIRAHRPAVRIVGVQAAGAPAMAVSWRTGRLVAYDRMDTIADGIGVRTPIPEAVQDMQGWVDEVALVSDEALIEAMRLLYQHAGFVVEPSGAAGVAAILEGRVDLRGARAATVLCGGNLTGEQMAQWLGARTDLATR